ncbi:SIMPL domain-containing protein [Halobacteria archaeon AArc-xg1-1]|uniref:SIMPL domain-containing protein n=1 Tax=Natronoglomus mannanivorans TaxID=2979990 RepID=A0AAP2Z3W0_9EURY|nr:SIMPL domain-containing protein [Halobacteria archaeon AArc-xg1-1]
MYRGVETIVVDVTPDRVEDVVLTGTDAGASVFDIHAKLTARQCAELRTEALAEATRNARESAKAIASTKGVELGAVRQVSEEGPSGLDGIVDEALAAGESHNLEPAPISIETSITATFEISTQSTESGD